MKYINIFRDSLWPDGKLRATSVPRTTEEKIRTRDEANRKLSALVPGTKGALLGQKSVKLIFLYERSGG